MKKVELEDGQSADIVSENISKLRELFPDAFSEGGVNFDTLRQLLGDASVLDEGEEKYGLNWHGKKKARQIALTPSTGTLLPCPDESVDWETTQNLFIEGDNLEVLKLLKKSYANKIKMIYIDPPYNTDEDFVYPDRFSEGLETYLNYTGQKQDGSWTISASGRDKAGRKHAAWLGMMLPRLKTARNLLKKDGVIAIHIDEHEIENLTILLNECFGEENNLGTIVWDKRNPKGDATKIAVQHEYLLVWARDIEALKAVHELKKPKANAEKMLRKAAQLFKKVGSSTVPTDLEGVVSKYDLDIDASDMKTEYTLENANADFQSWLGKQDVSGGEAAYKFLDVNGDIYQSVSMAWPNKKQAPADYLTPLVHPVTKKECPVPERGWRNPSSTMQDLLRNGEIVFGQDETTQPRRKYLLKNNMDENIPSIFPFGGSDDSLLSKMGVPFDNPKPVDFASQIVKFFSEDGDMVMDFFSGSSTVGHACYKLNAETNASFKFALVQLPQGIDGEKAAQKTAFKFCADNSLKPNIAEIGKERLRRAAKKIQDENPDYEGDLGFKVFKLAESNIRAWNPDRSDLEESLLSHEEHLIEGRTEQDVLYELLLKRGVDLAVPIESREVGRKNIYSIGYGVLFACLDESIAKEQIEDIAQGIIAWYGELAPSSDTHVFFRDSAFRDDVSKTNMAAILEQNGITHVRSL